MQSSRLKDRDYVRAALIGACALLAALAVLIFKQAADVRTLSARLSAVYQKAFYETCELMEGMSTNLRKLLVTGSAQQEQILLSEISRQAQGAQDNLAQLPLGEGAVSATIKLSPRCRKRRENCPWGWANCLRAMKQAKTCFPETMLKPARRVFIP